MDTGGCQDIDECLLDPCSPLVECENYPGGYTCGDCPQGYQGNGTYCEDINECEDASPCSPYAICTNSIGSFTCECMDGFLGDGFNCTGGKVRLSLKEYQILTNAPKDPVMFMSVVTTLLAVIPVVNVLPNTTDQVIISFRS